MRSKIKLLLVLLLAVQFVSIPTTEVSANSIVERIMKRWGKKNKLKKLGKRAGRMGRAIDLKEYSIKTDYDVIGVEPSWMLDSKHFTDHYFNLLTTLVVGEYDINPSTGAPRSMSSFKKHLDYKLRDKDSKKELNIIQRGDYYNPKMKFLLRMTYSGDYGTPGQSAFWEKNLLSDNDVYKNIADTLANYFVTLQDEYEIPLSRTGVYIDFDFTKNDYNLNNFISFLKKLRLELPESQYIYVAVPANIKKYFPYSLDIVKKINEIVDCIVIEATGFEKYQSNKPNTIFEKNNDYSVNGTLDMYLKEDTEGEFDGKFAVLLPYYASKRNLKQFITKEGRKSYKVGEINYLSLDNMFQQMGKKGKIKYMQDTLYGTFQEDNSAIYFLDDGKTLFYKFHYLKDTLGINNVAVDALGYYTGSTRIPEMWESIALTYGKERQKLGWTIAAYLMAFIPIGFVFSCVKYWEVRNALAKYNKYFTRFMMFFVVFVFLFLAAADVVPRNTVGLVIAAIILGLFALYILMKKVLIRSKKYVNIVK